MTAKKYLIRILPDLLLLLSCSLFFSFLLPRNQFLVPALLSIVLSSVFLLLSYPIVQRRKKKEAGIAFFSSFLEQLEMGYGGEKSYDFASQYLVGYVPVASYPEVQESGGESIPLGGRREVFSFFLEQEKKQEAHLLNTAELRKELSGEEERMLAADRKEETEKRTFSLLLGSLFLLLSVFSALFPAALSSIPETLSLFSSLFLSLPFPFLYAVEFFTLRKEASHE